MSADLFAYSLYRHLFFVVSCCRLGRDVHSTYILPRTNGRRTASRERAMRKACIYQTLSIWVNFAKNGQLPPFKYSSRAWAHGAGNPHLASSGDLEIYTVSFRSSLAVTEPAIRQQGVTDSEYDCNNEGHICVGVIPAGQGRYIGQAA
jgi:hypothetical protein